MKTYKYIIVSILTLALLMPSASAAFAATPYVSVPILMYHTASEEEPVGLTELYVKPSEFEKQIEYLVDNGYTACTFDDYANLKNIKKPVMITFDDGYPEIYTLIFPILKKYNFKVTLFLSYSLIEINGITEDMVREMSDSGLVKIESHSDDHVDLRALTPEKLDAELSGAKAKIEALTGKPVAALAYPYGFYNTAVTECTAKYYAYGVLAASGRNNTSLSPLLIRRQGVYRSTTMAQFKALVRE